MSAIEPVKRRSPTIPVSQGLAVRVAIVSGIAIAMFSVIFFRLWYLQVLSGEQYVHQADVNRVRDLPIQAPRGEILDREGKAIVSSRTTNAVQIVPSALPPSGLIEARSSCTGAWAGCWACPLGRSTPTSFAGRARSSTPP